jgi:integrase
MPGSIRRRGKSTWELTIDLGRDAVTGKRRRRFVNVKGTKREAERLLAEALHQRDTGIDFVPGKITVAEYLQRWLRDYAVHNVAPSTLTRYEGIVGRHLIPALGSLTLAQLRPNHIQAAYGRALAEGGRADGRSGGLSARTVLHHHRLLKEALSHAVRWQLIARNPADSAIPPRPERHEMRVLTREEAQSLLDAASNDPLDALVYLALATGARQGELLALRWADIDWDAAVMRITRTVRWLPRQGIVFHSPKTHRATRPVALSPETIRTLRQHRRKQAERRLKIGPDYKDQDLIFAQENGDALRASSLGKSLDRLLAKAGVKRIRFHDLRHTAATLMLVGGVHPKVVSERLGHATISITLDTYSHVLPDLQKDAATVMDSLLNARP